MKYKIPITKEIFKCDECGFQKNKDFRIEKDGIKYCPNCGRIAVIRGWGFVESSVEKSGSWPKYHDDWKNFPGIVKIRQKEERKLRRYLVKKLINFLETGKIKENFWDYIESGRFDIGYYARSKDEKDPIKIIHSNMAGISHVQNLDPWPGLDRNNGIFTLTDICSIVSKIFEVLVEKRGEEAVNYKAFKAEKGVAIVEVQEEIVLKNVSKKEFDEWKERKEKKGFRVYFFRTMEEIKESDLSKEDKETCRERMKEELLVAGKKNAGVVAIIPLKKKSKKKLDVKFMKGDYNYEINRGYRWTH